MNADFILHSSKGIVESFDNAVGNEIETLKDTRLMDIANTSVWSEEFTSTEGMSGSKVLGELETPPVLELAEGRSITLTPYRWGSAVQFTEDDYMKTGDNTTMVQEVLTRKRNALLTDLKWSLIDDMFYLYNNAFNSSALTLAPDGVELCGDHLDKNGSAWFTNKDTHALSTTSIATMEAYGGAFKDAKGKQRPISFNTIVVKKGGSASVEAKKLFANGIAPTKVADVNIYEGQYTIIETPMITDGAYWFAYDSNYPVKMPLGVRILKAPQMNDPIKEKNVSVNYSATGYWKKGILNAPINFYGSTGAIA